MAEIQSSNDTNVDGDVVGGNAQTVNVSAPDIASLVVHLAEVAAHQARVAEQQIAITEHLTRHDSRLEQFAGIVIDLFEQVFVAVDDVSAQIAIAQKMAELQVLVSGRKRTASSDD